MVNPVNTATPSMVKNQRWIFSRRKKDTSMGNTMLHVPITPRPTMLLMEASSPRCRLSRVDTESIMLLAVP